MRTNIIHGNSSWGWRFAYSWRELECRKLHSVTAVGFCAVYTSLFFTYWLPTRLTFFAQKLTKITFILYVVWFAPGAKKIYHIFASFNSQKSLRTTEIKQLSRVKVHYLRVQLLGTENYTSRVIFLSLSLFLISRSLKCQYVRLNIHFLCTNQFFYMHLHENQMASGKSCITNISRVRIKVMQFHCRPSLISC